MEITAHKCTPHKTPTVRKSNRKSKCSRSLQESSSDDDDRESSPAGETAIPFLKSESENDTEEQKFTCDTCQKEFQTLSELQKHLRVHFGAQKKKKFKCISCHMVFVKRRALSEHLKTHTEFRCNQCPAKFTFATNLRKHIRGHSRSASEEKPIPSPTSADKRTCDICLKVFKYRPSMLKHKRRHNSTEKHCQHCKLTFGTSVQLYKHMEQAHNDLKNIVCTICGKRFFREWNLKMHMAVHSGVKPYMCETCGVSFALAGNLTSHKRLHTGEKPYLCTVCHKGFTQQAALKSHEAGHSDKKDHVCPDCGRAFSRAGALRNHRKRHLDARPFPCSVCGKCFTFSSERKRHMTIHSGENSSVGIMQLVRGK